MPPLKIDLKSTNFQERQKNRLSTLMFQQAIQGKKEEEIGKTTGEVKSDIESAFGGNVPPDTSLSVGSKGTTASIPLNRKYSSEETVSLGGTDNISRHLAYVRNAMKTDPSFAERFQSATFRTSGTGEKGSIFGIPTTLGDKESKKLAFHLNDLNTRLVYLLSGKQINEQEFQRLSRNTPSFTDIDIENDPNYEVLNERLNSFEADMNNIKGRLIEGGTYDARYWEEDTQPSSQSPIPGMNEQINDTRSLEDELRKLYANG